MDNKGCSALYHAIENYKGGSFDLITLLLDGNAKIDQIYKEIRHIIDSLDT